MDERDGSRDGDGGRDLAVVPTLTCNNGEPSVVAGNVDILRAEISEPFAAAGDSIAWLGSPSATSDATVVWRMPWAADADPVASSELPTRAYRGELVANDSEAIAVLPLDVAVPAASLRRVPTTGPAMELGQAPGQPVSGLALDDRAVYWTMQESGSITLLRSPLEPGMTTRLGSVALEAQRNDDSGPVLLDGFVYVGLNVSWSVYRAPADGSGALESVAYVNNGVRALATDGTALYVMPGSALAETLAPSAIFRIVEGGAPEPAIEIERSGKTLAIESGRFYWTADDGLNATLWSAPVDGSETPVRIVSVPNLDAYPVTWMATRPDGVYAIAVCPAQDPSSPRNRYAKLYLIRVPPPG